MRQAAGLLGHLAAGRHPAVPEAVAGTNKGLRVLYRFAGSANRAVVWARALQIPARGSSG